MVTGQFSESFPPIMDGVALTVSNYAAELNRTLGPCYTVIPAIPHSPGRHRSEVLHYFSVPLVSRPPYRLGVPRLDLSIAPKLRQLRFDLIHSHSPFSAGWLALRVARGRGIPIVATLHSKYRDDLTRAVPLPWLVDWAIRRLVKYYESVDEVWVPSLAAREALREYGFRGSVEVVRNGVDLQPPAGGGRAPRARSGVFALLYVGQHVWVKNLALLIRSLAAVRGMGAKFRMVFVGEGCDAGDMKAMAERLGLADCTTFIGVVHDRAALASHYAQADCLLLPSVYDNNPLVVMEAAAFRVPSLLIRDSGAAEGVADGVNGFLAENSVASYAAKLRRLIAEPEPVDLAGAGARRSLYRSWQSVVAEVRDRYLRLVQTTRHRGKPVSA
jgi:1,2-diacylglycerol 3-alpha-glucosyltransferase